MEGCVRPDAYVIGSLVLLRSCTPHSLTYGTPGTVSYLQRFEEECRLLSLARHPNVVHYLGTYRDPGTRLPVLLMELCDESLCRFLEHSLPYSDQHCP